MVLTLDFELVIYTDNVKACRRFDNLDGIVDLAKLVLQTNKLLFVYQPLKLLLILSVATTSVQTCFSVMSVVQKVEKQDE
jgi:hypothetical protein